MYLVRSPEWMILQNLPNNNFYFIKAFRVGREILPLGD